MDSNFCEDAARTCGNAINMIIDIWPARYKAGEELRETLQELSRLRDFFTGAGWEAEARERREERKAAAAVPVIGLDIDAIHAKIAKVDATIKRIEDSLPN